MTDTRLIEFGVWMHYTFNRDWYEVTVFELFFALASRECCHDYQGPRQPEDGRKAGRGQTELDRTFWYWTSLAEVAESPTTFAALRHAFAAYAYSDARLHYPLPHHAEGT